MGRGWGRRVTSSKIIRKTVGKKKISLQFKRNKEGKKSTTLGDDNSGKHALHLSQTCSPPQEHRTRLFRHCYSPTKFLYVEHKPTSMVTREFYNCSLISQQKTGKNCEGQSEPQNISVPLKIGAESESLRSSTQRALCYLV